MKGAQPMLFRTSTPCDIPQLETLWELAFGDGGDYLDNFFRNYYTPDRVVVIEDGYDIIAMTAWYPSTFHTEIGDYRCGYLYAVATHPDRRGQGLASRLLDFCDDYLHALGYHGVTTVPARPDLHLFFGQNGFGECFYQGEREFLSTDLPTAVDGVLTPVTAEEYHLLREEFLTETPHVSLDLDGIVYQAGASKLSGGGLYRLGSHSLLCTEGGSDGDCYVKELLGSEDALSLLPTVSSAHRYFVRTPLGDWQFGMLKWLSPMDWNWDSRAYLGFAFD